MANNCGPNCECKGSDPYQSVTLVLNAREVDALHRLISAGRIFDPEAARVIYDRLSVAIFASPLDPIREVDDVVRPHVCPQHSGNGPCTAHLDD